MIKHKKFVSLTSVFLLFIFLSGCSVNNKTNTEVIQKNTILTVKSLSNDSTNTEKNLPKNMFTETVKDAENIPHLFYQYLNNKKYDSAINLLSPTLKFEGDPSMRKYLENLEHTDFIEFKDITSESGFLNAIQEQYYAVKIYYAVIRINVKDKNLVPTLNGTQYRRMVVIKTSKDSPWLLDADEDTPKM